MQTFKVGDWIKEPNNTLTKLKEIPELNSYYAEECVLWKPQPGEWCWFWDAGNQPVLSRYKGYTKLTGYICDGDWYQKDMTGFQFCEPFIGELPSFLKEDKWQLLQSN